MNRIDIFVLFCALSGTAAQAKPLFEHTLVACPPQICGADDGKGGMTLDSGQVTVAPSGRVNVSIQGLRDEATGEILAHVHLELRYGMVYNRHEHTQYLGYCYTDAEGNYSGPVIGGMQGRHYDPYKAYKFAPGSSNAGSFLLSRPPEDEGEGVVGPQTKFISGFTVAN